MATAALNHYTPKAYLALERHAEFKSEFLDGRIIAMTGGGPGHAEVVLNLGSELRARLRPRGCRVFVTDVRAKIDSISGYVYPDVMVVCGRAAFLDTRPRTLADPTLVIEVLSDTTEGFDRGENLEAYRSVESLMEYVLVDARRPYVEWYAREGELWAYSSETDIGATLELRTIGCALSLREIYADVELPLPHDRESRATGSFVAVPGEPPPVH